MKIIKCKIISCTDSQNFITKGTISFFTGEVFKIQGMEVLNADAILSEQVKFKLAGIEHVFPLNDFNGRYFVDDKALKLISSQNLHDKMQEKLHLKPQTKKLKI